MVAYNVSGRPVRYIVGNIDAALSVRLGEGSVTGIGQPVAEGFGAIGSSIQIVGNGAPVATGSKIIQFANSVLGIGEPIVLAHKLSVESTAGSFAGEGRVLGTNWTTTREGIAVLAGVGQPAAEGNTGDVSGAGIIEGRGEPVSSGQKLGQGSGAFAGDGDPRAAGQQDVDDNTSILLHFDGTDGSTTITDSGPIGHTCTASNGAHIETSQSVFGGASAEFDGSNDIITVPDHASLKMGTGDFTVDFRARFDTLTASRGCFSKGTSSSNRLHALCDTSGRLNFILGGTTLISASSSIALDTWYHIAATRSGSTARLFINGVLIDTETDSTDLTNTVDLVIGRSGAGAAERFMDGWIDEFRIVKGEAAWTADFTPPSAPYS